MDTKPPWSFILRAVSPMDRPSGMVSVRKRPVTSPSEVRTSSPTMTRNGAILLTAFAPSVVLWSVTAMQFRPTFWHLATRRSGETRESGEKWVCMWRSTLSMAHSRGTSSLSGGRRICSP